MIKITITCSVVQYALCMHCTWLLYMLNENNFVIDVRPDSRQVSDKTSMNNLFSYVYKKTKRTLTEYYCRCRYFPLQSLQGREMTLQLVPDNSMTNRTSWRGSRRDLLAMFYPVHNLFPRVGRGWQAYVQTMDRSL